MYNAYFNLKQSPFENTPDPRFFFASEEHREALAAIEYTIRARKGYVMVTGDVGSGKTTVSRMMINRCSDDARIVPILHGHQSVKTLLKQILRALEIAHHKEDDHAVLLEQLFTFLHEQLEVGEPVVLLVDEAHTLSDDALEELRLLSNYDTAHAKLVQVILVGQPKLVDRMQTPQLAALRQRLAMVKTIRTMNIQETAAYIGHRLRVASINPKQLAVRFPGKSLEAIHRASGGTPRLINFICDNALLMASVKQVRQIDPFIIGHVLADMTPSLGQRTSTSEAPRLALAGNM